MVALNEILMEQSRKRERVEVYPSSPRLPPEVNIIAKSPGGVFNNWAFAGLFGARKMVEFLIADRTVKWVDENTILINDEVTVTTDKTPDGLSDIMEHEFSPAERAWELPAAYMRQAFHVFVEKPKPTGEEYWQNLPEPKKREPKEAREPKEKKPKKERPSGLVDLPTMLSDTDIDPKEARMALRAMKAEKPDHGRWEWPEAEAKAMKDKIVAAVKKARKK